MRPRVGDPAPDFRCPCHTGQIIEIGSSEQEQVTVLYFYPADETYGCTMEACRFRDEYERFVEAGARVVGVSPDDLESHRRFAEHHGLPFSLVSDADGELRRRYGVGRTLGLVPGRVTFVIDRQGVVRHVFDSQLRAKRHVDEALQVVRRLSVR
ncbi:MAG: peroxiredoxin [Myxococcales bacterium]|nr:peroxiredoxin [Myxococcales bacterium]